MSIGSGASNSPFNRMPLGFIILANNPAQTNSTSSAGAPEANKPAVSAENTKASCADGAKSLPAQGNDSISFNIININLPRNNSLSGFGNGNTSLNPFMMNQQNFAPSMNSFNGAPLLPLLLNGGNNISGNNNLFSGSSLAQPLFVPLQFQGNQIGGFLPTQNLFGAQNLGSNSNYAADMVAAQASSELQNSAESVLKIVGELFSQSAASSPSTVGNDTNLMA